MKTKILFSAMTLLAGSLIAADSSPKDDVSAAATALAGKNNYSWNQTVVVPEDSPFKPGPTDGKTEQGGFTYVTSTFGDNNLEIVAEGGKTVINSPDNGWQTPEELQNDQGPGRFMAMMARNLAVPAAQATNVIALTKEITKDGEAYVSDLSEDGVKKLIAFRRRAAGGNGPEVTDAKGSVKFWIKDGVLSKYELKVSGKVNFNGDDRDMSRTTTVVIKDIGTTKIEIPDGAKKKLNPEPAPAPAPAAK